ncbi:hypothetical protein [Negadavirga shengliensis]|uniref:MarR family transcriptional regulator n=1 Tax=Negadavirga shengliensis TaxID=1389218 RepID=A0ABV9T3W4_9BACT
MVIENKKLPIGYWIKHADQLLTSGINQVQHSFSLTRTSWQVLNSIASKPDIDRESLLEVMQPFAGEKSVSTILCEFFDENIISIQGGLRLSEKGKQLYKDCLKAQQAFRKKAMAGISEVEYEISVKTLSQLVSNLSRPEASRRSPINGKHRTYEKEHSR